MPNDLMVPVVLEPKPLRTRWFPSLSLRALILALFFMIFVGSWSIISIYIYNKNSKYLKESGQYTLLKNGSSIYGDIMSHFEQAQKTLHKLRFYNQPLSILQSQFASRSMMGSLAAEPLHSSYFIGDIQGNFLLINRLVNSYPEQTSGVASTSDHAAFHLWLIARQGDVAHDFHQYFDHFGSVMTQHLEQISGFDPRQRPWFRHDLNDQNRVLWTDPYTFNAGGFGVTGSLAIYDPGKQSAGRHPSAVIAMDLASKDLEAIVKNKKFYERSFTMIADRSGKILASCGLEPYAKNPQTKELLSVRDYNAPLLDQIFQSAQSQSTPVGTVIFDKMNYHSFVAKFPENFGSGWYLIVSVSENEFIFDFRSSVYERLVIVLSIVILCIVLLVVFSGRLTRPIQRIAEDMRRIQDLEIDHSFDVRSSCREITKMVEALKSMKQGLDSFSHFVPRVLVRQLIQSGKGAQLGGEKRKVTMLFSDIQGFTSISETMEAIELSEKLSEYLTAVTEIIQQHNGTVDKYIGDSVMAFWGAPIDNPRQVYDACLAVVKIQERLGIMNQKWREEGHPEFITRFGLHTGEVLVGNLGSIERMNYTLIGDDVNLASRLEGLNKNYHTYVMASQNIVAEVKDQFIFRPLDRVAVKGKTHGIEVFELRAVQSTEAAKIPEVSRLVSQMRLGLDAYYAQKWDDAIVIFQQLKKLYPDDKPVALMIERCQSFKATPPEPEWNGVTHMDHK